MFDKGYCDSTGVIRSTVRACFVTRLKSNAVSTRGEQNPASIPSNRKILGDHLVSFKHRRPGGKTHQLKYYGTPFAK